MHSIAHRAVFSWLIFIRALLNLCLKFKKNFGQKHSFEELWKWQQEKMFTSCPRVCQIQDLGRKKYKKGIFSDVQRWKQISTHFSDSTHQECMIFARIGHGPCYYRWNEIFAGVKCLNFQCCYLIDPSSKWLQMMPDSDQESILRRFSRKLLWKVRPWPNFGYTALHRYFEHKNLRIIVSSGQK